MGYGKPNENTPKNWTSSYVDYNVKTESMDTSATPVKQEGDRKRKLSEASAVTPTVEETDEEKAKRKAEKKAKKKAKKEAEEAANPTANTTLNSTVESVNGDDGDGEKKKKEKEKEERG